MFKNLTLTTMLIAGIINPRNEMISRRSGIDKPMVINPTKYIDVPGIKFIEGSWNAAVKRASAEKKLIFVDAYAVWCAPCRQLKTTTFKDKAVAAFFNSTFINLSLDMEKGDGIKLSERWDVHEFPTLIIVDEKGNIVNGNAGFMDAAALMKLGQRALTTKK